MKIFNSYFTGYELIHESSWLFVSGENKGCGSIESGRWVDKGANCWSLRFNFFNHSFSLLQAIMAEYKIIYAYCYIFDRFMKNFFVTLVQSLDSELYIQYRV